MRAVTAALVLLGALVRPAPAHALGPLDVLLGEETREARADTGLQTGVVSWLAYGQRLPELWEHALAWEARLGGPVVSLDLGDLALEGGVQAELAGWGRFKLRNQLDLGVRTVENTVFSGVELALRETLAFGWFARRGFVGVDLGWEQGLATHITHSDWYRREIYPEAEDGWLAFPSGRLRFAGFAGMAPTRRLLLALRVGRDLDRSGKQDFVPLVAVLTAAWSF